MKIYNDVYGIVINGEGREQLVFSGERGIVFCARNYGRSLTIKNFRIRGFYVMSLWRKFVIAWRYFWKIVRAKSD